MADRKLDPDKVYLRGPNGKVYDYEPQLAKQVGFARYQTAAKKEQAKEDTSAKSQDKK